MATLPALSTPALEAGHWFFSPAGRWEQITAVALGGFEPVLVWDGVAGPSLADRPRWTLVHTAALDAGYCWKLFHRARWRCLPGSETPCDEPKTMVVYVHFDTLSIEAGIAESPVVVGHRPEFAYSLLNAPKPRSGPWTVFDEPDGCTRERLTLPAKRTRAGYRGAAYAEVLRRAELHALRLRLPLAEGGKRS